MKKYLTKYSFLYSRTCDKDDLNLDSWPESIQSKLTTYLGKNITQRMDKAPGPERKCKKLVHRYLYPEKICRDQIKFLERLDQNGARTVKLKGKFKEDLLEENEFCIDMKEDDKSKEKDFVVALCREMEEDMKFK